MIALSISIAVLVIKVVFLPIDSIAFNIVSPSVQQSPTRCVCCSSINRNSLSFESLAGYDKTTSQQQRHSSRRRCHRNRHHSCQQLLSLAAATKSKWDYLDEIDNDDDNDKISTAHIARDMKYNKRNCERSNKIFLAIRTAGGPVNDVYCRRKGDTEPTATDDDSTTFLSDVFWFIGKVARVSDITIEQCMERQYDLLLHHAAYLRPIELYTGLITNRLELWVAPGDTELEVAYNNPSVKFSKVPLPTNTEQNKDTTIVELVKNSFVGFQGEIYSPGEEGFRTLRNADGTPTKPEIQPSPTTAQSTGMNADDDDDNDDNNSDEQFKDLDEFRMPTDEEMAQIYKLLEGKDLNEIYEEQERQKKE